MKAWKWLITVLIIGLLVSYYIFTTGLLKENRRSVDLNAQIETLAAALSAMPPASPDLEERLSAARTGLEAAEKTFSGETNDTRIVDFILRLAEETNVKAIPLSTRPWALEQIEGYNYAVFFLTVSVTGEFLQLQSFIQKLETSEFSTLVMKKLQVARTPAETGAAVTANMDIAVYTFVARAE